MKKELADFILQACENNDCLFSDRGLELPQIRENYQGRGHSKPSFAITFEGSISVIMAAIVCESAELDVDDDWPADLSDIARLEQDSMGTGSVIY
jgi:hypothetical protein